MRQTNFSGSDLTGVSLFGSLAVRSKWRRAGERWGLDSGGGGGGRSCIGSCGNHWGHGHAAPAQELERAAGYPPKATSSFTGTTMCLHMLCDRLTDCPSNHLQIGANFSGANLTNADLESADFEGADFTNAILTGAYVNNAQFKDVKITGTDCESHFLRFLHSRACSCAASSKVWRGIGGIRWVGWCSLASKR